MQQGAHRLDGRRPRSSRHSQWDPYSPQVQCGEYEGSASYEEYIERATVPRQLVGEYDEYQEVPINGIQ